MAKIHLLSEDIINKIAAGEVIERPASVVKELIENSLDAEATSLNIEIEEAGKKLIRVQDNGEGMDPEDAQASILRHATSKIITVDDLFAISSLGFRGEALASIAAVSQLSITTKKKESTEGFQLQVEAGQIKESSIHACDGGTTIEVKNLFFNTPARKKFLKSDTVEVKHIVDVLTHYALHNPTINIKVKHNNYITFHSPSVSNLRSNIATIYGAQLAKELLEVSYTSPVLQIQGFISTPYHCRNDKEYQSLTVNKRWVRSEDVSQAVYEAFHTMLFVNKHPIFILGLTLDPQKLDVNVHPNKLEIKFEQKQEVYLAVLTAVKEALQKHNLLPEVEIADEQLTFGLPIIKPVRKEVKYAFQASSQAILRVKEPSLAAEYSSEKVMQVPEAVEVKPNLKFPLLKILGQIHKTYFVAETLGGVFFIDQHAAHERVMYEQFMEQYIQKKIEVQQILSAAQIETSPAETIIIKENKQALQEFGFSLEEFGHNTFRIKTIPEIFRRLQPIELLQEVLHLVQQEKSKIHHLKEMIITRMACRAAVMAGEELTSLQMENILQQLSLTTDPYTCPHGRPVMIKTNVDELEKKFRRK